MSSDDTCCTCASILNAKPPSYPHSLPSRSTPNEKATVAQHEKTTEPHLRFTTPQSNLSTQFRHLPCCHRLICAACIAKNARFETYCPFCQISSTPSALPQGLRDPPTYDSRPPSPKPLHSPSDSDPTSQPPAYSAHQQPTPGDTTHHLRPTDSLQSISLAYGVPLRILRLHNNLYSDHLLSARRTLSIPASHYAGPSLSPTPADSEAETERKAHLRRFMVAAKCVDYEVAQLYLSDAGGDVEAALSRWRDDERWERENPFRPGTKKSQTPRRRKFAGSGLTGQLG